MIWFVVKPHSTLHGIYITEIWRDKGEGEYVGAIYPEADGIKIVSAYKGMVRAEIETTVVPDVSGRPAKYVAPLRVINIEIGEERLTQP